ncbi:1-acylglycerol-3-phosphate O-acyltransferase ABHD5-like isoform X3 [Antedon mediterranea]|uniref:1-acylglycerol-3-phosphate O-acyltransferase ABHD5-like isoform X3 n=1 Tax=Antedon mediterranea TaxID=105859 RepID=UPI003AF7DDCF
MASAAQSCTESNELQLDSRDNYWFGGWLRWVPTSNEMLRAAEEKILGYVRNTYRSWFVKTKSGDRIRTIFMNNSESDDKTPIVLVHGMAGGIGLWVQNLDALSNVRPLYAFDLIGFGRSTRRKFPSNADDSEKEFVNSIEEWREEVGVDKMILVGHSLGGFLSYSYSIHYPERVKHLILVDPWGFPERDVDFYEKHDFPLWLKVVRQIMITFNPLSGLRAAGPFGLGSGVERVVSYGRIEPWDWKEGMLTTKLQLHYCSIATVLLPNLTDPVPKLQLHYLICLN